MQQLTERLTVMVTNEIINYPGVISTKYKVKRSEFIRKAILEKLKRDVPKLRVIKKADFCPF